MLVEDDPNDAELVLRELRRGGYEPLARRVETASEMRAALGDETWDVVISDHSLPTFSAPEAFALVKSLNLDLPFIIVSGTVGEDIAVEAMRTGVHDFLLKGQLRRLVGAIERELREAAIRAERRKIHEQLLISDRMASVGTLAAGVAHEINNPLSVVVGNLQILGQDIRALAEKLETLPAAAVPVLGGELGAISTLLASIREATRDAEESADRVRLIVRDLRVFSRSEEDIRDSVDVHRVLESSIRMARNELRHRAKVIRRFGNVPGVHANEARLGQVFLNLIVNAAQAIGEVVALSHQPGLIKVRSYRDGDHAVIEVEDTGTGIPEPARARVFEPFFTTKAPGKGTGQGLAIARTIVVDRHGGEISFETELGRGTTFKVRLPLEPPTP